MTIIIIIIVIVIMVILRDINIYVAEKRLTECVYEEQMITKYDWFLFFRL